MKPQSSRKGFASRIRFAPGVLVGGAKPQSAPRRAAAPQATKPAASKSRSQPVAKKQRGRGRVIGNVELAHLVRQLCVEFVATVQPTIRRLVVPFPRQ